MTSADDNTNDANSREPGDNSEPDTSAIPADQEPAGEQSHEEKTVEEPAVASQPARSERGPYLLRVIRECIEIYLKLAAVNAVVIVLVFFSPQVRIAFAHVVQAFNGLESGTLEVHAPASITTKERFSLRLDRDGAPGKFRLKIYKKTNDPRLMSGVGQKEFELSPNVLVRENRLFETLSNTPAVWEGGGTYHFVDYGQVMAVTTVDTALPVGDYFYLLEDPVAMGRESGSHGTREAGAFRVTDLGLIIKASHDKFLAKVFNLLTLEPVAGAKVQMSHRLAKDYDEVTATTGKDGLVVVPATPDIAESRQQLVWSATAGGSKATNWQYFYVDPERTDSPQRRGQTSMQPTFGAFGAGSFPALASRRNTYMVCDRPVYRLGQDVFVKSITRLINDDGLYTKTNEAIDVIVRDSQNAEIAKFALRTGQFGDADFKFTIPKEGHTGNYNVSITYPDGLTCSKTIEILQYRKPEFLVELVPSTGHTVAGKKLKTKLVAKYFFGGPVRNAKVEYRVQSSANYQTRDSLRELSEEENYFRYFLNDGNTGNSPCYGNSYYSRATESVNIEGTAITNDAGEAEIEIGTASGRLNDTSPFDQANLEQDYIVSAKVTDLSRKVVEGSGSALVTPSDIALILKSDRQVLAAGEHVKASVLVRDYDGKKIGPQEITVVLDAWDYDWKASKYRLNKTISRTKVVADKDGIANIDVPIASNVSGGEYFLRVESKDKNGFKCGDSCRLWLQGPEMATGTEDLPSIQILTDKNAYKPGDKIRALIQLPAFKGSSRATGLATIERRTIHSYRNLSFEGRQKVIEISVDESFIPNVFLSVCSVDGSHQYRSQEKAIFVYPEKKVLNVDLSSDKSKYEPGQEVTIKARVTTGDGKAAPNTQLTLAVADESIFSIHEDDTPGIIGQFYTPDRDYIRTLVSFEGAPEFKDIFPAIIDFERPNLFGSHWNSFMPVPPAVSTAAFSCGWSGGTNCSSGSQSGDACVIQGCNTAGTVRQAELRLPDLVPAPPPPPPPPAAPFKKDVVLRKEFKDTALWAPHAVTDKDGVASWKIKAPDNLTKWRASLHGISADSKGGDAYGEFSTTKDLLARLSMPRFFTEQDQSVITGIVHNYSGKRQKVDLELKSSDLISLEAPSRQKLDLAPDSEARFTWPMRALLEGKAEITLKAVGETKSDGLVEKIPVRAFTYPAFACKNGILKEDSDSVKLPLKLAKDAKQGNGRFTLNMACSAIGPVLGDFDALIEYPYGCTEQTMSRMVPSMVAMQLHKSLGVPMTDATKVRLWNVYRQAIRTIISYQNNDGAWGWWPGDNSDVFLTAYVMEGLYRLRQAGFTYDTSLLDSGKSALNQLTSSLTQPKWTIDVATDHAYGLYAMSLFGERLSNEAVQRQLKNLRHLPPEGLAYLTLALKKSGRTKEAEPVYKRLLELAHHDWDYVEWDHKPEMWNKFGFTGSYDYTFQFSGVESTALALRAVLAMEPENEKLLTSIRRWLLVQHDENGWSNTKTTAAVFLSLLEDEINSRGGKATHFRADAIVSNKTLASMLFNEKDQYAADKTMEFAVKSTDEFIEVKKIGPGRLYYNSLLKYDRPMTAGRQGVALASPPGLVIERAFCKPEPYTDPQTKVESFREVPIVQPVKVGDEIMMVVSVNSPIQIPYMKVEVPLPSGAEVVTEGALVGTSANCVGGNKDWWLTHYDVLDDRVVFFVRDLTPAPKQFRVFLRFEMPGKYNVVPVSLESMYSKFVRGYSQADQLTVIETKGK